MTLFFNKYPNELNQEKKKETAHHRNHLRNIRQATFLNYLLPVFTVLNV